MINRLFLSLILVLTASIATAQTYKINGQVVDEKNHPLPYAVIAIEGKGNVAATDESGSFSINIKSGSYLLRATLLGYKTTHKKVNIPQDRSVTIRLKEDYKQLGEVLVVGPDHAKQIQDGVYAAKSLNVRPYVASTNSLNNLLGYTSGVRIREEGGIGSNFDLTLTGLGGNAIRYFIDGVPLTSLGSGTNIANLPINIVDRVEIYKGVVPPELGLDALGGAVNIITRKESKNYLEVSINGGSFHTYGADLSGEYRVNSNGFTVRGNGSFTSTRNNYIMRGVEVWNRDANEYQTGDYRRFHDGYRSFSGEVQAGFTQTKWADEALIGIYYADSKSEVQTGLSQKLVIGAAERYRDALRVSLNYSKRNLLVRGLTAKLFASHTLDHVLFADTTFRKYFWDGSFLESNISEITQRGKMLRHIKRPTTVVRTNLSYQLTRTSSLNLNYTLTANHNNRSDSYDEDFIPTSDFLARHIVGLSYSKYWWGDRVNSTIFLKDYILQASIDQEDMYWITGAREVDHEVTRNNIGYGIGTRITFAKELSLKLSYENATRLPTV
uniref:carboxypeptidase-like regulatory domain-containing protein n=1 Tax=uncultured Porphyromonas sp. TaxID=159274 RepID=UPI002614C82F